jgi:hypothetical protein
MELARVSVPVDMVSGPRFSHRMTLNPGAGVTPLFLVFLSP